MTHQIVEARLKEAAAFYQASPYGYRAVAEKFGLDWQAMRRAFIKMGIKPKPGGSGRGKAVRQNTELSCPSCGHKFPAIEGLPK